MITSPSNKYRVSHGVDALVFCEERDILEMLAQVMLEDENKKPTEEEEVRVHVDVTNASDNANVNAPRTFITTTRHPIRHDGDSSKVRIVERRRRRRRRSRRTDG